MFLVKSVVNQGLLKNLHHAKRIRTCDINNKVDMTIPHTFATSLMMAVFVTRPKPSCESLKFSVRGWSPSSSLPFSDWLLEPDDPLPDWLPESESLEPDPDPDAEPELLLSLKLSERCRYFNLILCPHWNISANILYTHSVWLPSSGEDEELKATAKFVFVKIHKHTKAGSLKTTIMSTVRPRKYYLLFHEGTTMYHSWQPCRTVTTSSF